MENPYAAPIASSSDVSHSGGGISSQVIEMLARTKGWVRFLAVLGFLGAVLLIFIALAIMVTGGSEFGDFGWVIGLVYLLVAGVYFYFAFKLNQYASRIAFFVAQPSSATLASALDSQRLFWKATGIMAIVTIVLYFSIIAVVVVMAASRSM